MNSEKEREIDALIEKMKDENERGIISQRATARLMTYVENDVELASYIVKNIYPFTGNAYIIGITGAPGSGKSSLITSMIEIYIKMGKRIGIIAVDPTSPFTGGAILGDRIRMKRNFSSNDVFIRSMANRGQLGGIARATKDMAKVLDAAAYDIILIETVGVGQSEVEVFKSAHTTVVIVVPGMGDEIQAIKAGIMEITDIFVVNKMDLPGADRKVTELEAILDLSEKISIKNSKHSVKVVRSEGWRPPIIKTNAIKGQNISEFINLIIKHKQFLVDNNQMMQRLNVKYKNEVLDILKYKLTEDIEELIYHNPHINEYIQKIISKKNDPYTISEEIFLKFVHMGEPEYTEK
ncbi:MAG: methylmalonyl Co-A mutase-associated GTPase MeaB [Promethearchaeota archaeon]